MANQTGAFGLRPVRYFNGSPWNGKGRPYYIPATDSTALFLGDPVVIVGDSNDNEIMGHVPGSLSEVTIATAGDGNVITGVVIGVMSTTAESLIYRAASTERVLLVCDDPDVIFQIRDDAVTALTADTVGLNAVLIAGTGSTVTGRSAWALDSGGDVPAADASNQLFILNLANIPGNEIATSAVWEVLINQHTYKVRGGLGVA